MIYKKKYKYLNFKIANVGASYMRSLPKNKKWNTQHDVNLMIDICLCDDQSAFSPGNQSNLGNKNCGA